MARTGRNVTNFIVECDKCKMQVESFEVFYDVCSMTYVVNVRCHAARQSHRIPDTDLVLGLKSPLQVLRVFEPPVLDLPPEPALPPPVLALPPPPQDGKFIDLSKRIKPP